MTRTRHTVNLKYHGFTIEENDYGWFNVPAINCWSAASIERAKLAIDRFAERHGLCEHGCYKSSVQPVCGCPGDQS